MSPDDLSPEQARAFQSAFNTYCAAANRAKASQDVMEAAEAGRAWRACMEIYFQIPVPVRIRVPNGRPDLRVVK